MFPLTRPGIVYINTDIANTFKLCCTFSLLVLQCFCVELGLRLPTMAACSIKFCLIADMRRSASKLMAESNESRQAEDCEYCCWLVVSAGLQHDANLK